MDAEITGGSRINIFMNLNEGVLNQLLEEHHENEEVEKNIKYWKEAYERSKRKDN
jgi:hypothetical protein